MAETTGLIEQYAQYLEHKASGVVLRLAVLGALVGAALGGFPLFQHANALVPHHLAYATLLLGAAAGAYLGWSLGERRAVDLRFQAQLALRQLQVEQAQPPCVCRLRLLFRSRPRRPRRSSRSRRPRMCRPSMRLRRRNLLRRPLSPRRRRGSSSRRSARPARRASSAQAAASSATATKRSAR